MKTTNIPPIFVPERHIAEVEKLSKAALMDIAWNLCVRQQTLHPMSEFRRQRDMIAGYRKRVNIEKQLVSNVELLIAGVPDLGEKL